MFLGFVLLGNLFVGSAILHKFSADWGEHLVEGWAFSFGTENPQGIGGDIQAGCFRPFLQGAFFVLIELEVKGHFVLVQCDLLIIGF
jgi:hypothetical protein